MYFIDFSYALSRVIISVPKEVLPSYIKLVRDAVSTSRDKERSKKKVRLLPLNLFLSGTFRYCFWFLIANLHILCIIALQGGPILIPGFCLPKALQPILPIFLQVLFFSFHWNFCILYDHYMFCNPVSHLPFSHSLWIFKEN